MLTRIAVVVAVLAASFAGEAAAQSDSVARFRLFNDCRPVNLLVTGRSDDAADIDLTEERIRTLAESRLRAARLYDATAGSHLSVRVDVLVLDDRRGGAFSIEVSFNMRLFNAETGQFGMARTWSTISYGIHDEDAGYILQILSEHLDRFILEYLRVNEDACAP